MKTKIQSKTVIVKVLFEYEKEDNSVKNTLVKAVKDGSYLTEADLRGAYLRERKAIL